MSPLQGHYLVSRAQPFPVFGKRRSQVDGRRRQAGDSFPVRQPGDQLRRRRRLFDLQHGASQFPM